MEMRLIAGGLMRQGQFENGFVTIMSDLLRMPTTMKQLAVVQFFSWFAWPSVVSASFFLPLVSGGHSVASPVFDFAQKLTRPGKESAEFSLQFACGF